MKSITKLLLRVLGVMLFVWTSSIAFAQTPVTFNTPVTGSVDATTPQALFTFTGSAGQAVNVNITANDPLRVQFGVFDANGVLLLAGMNSSQEINLSETVTLPTDGTYILQVISSNGLQGQFVFTLTANSVPVAPASADSCEAIMRQISQALDTFCSTTGRNQACYGNLLIDAEPSTNVVDLSTFQFDRQGDIQSLTNLSALELSPMDQDNGTWGVALMQVQANIPDALPGTNVTVLAFGGMQIVDANTMGSTANPAYGPMQSIYIRPGIGATRCANTPDNGLLIRTPEGAGTINMAINEIEINVGSTVFITPDLQSSQLKFATLEGQVEVTTNGVTQVATTGFEVNVPVNLQMLPSGPPQPPQPTDPTTIELLPVEGLLPSAETPDDGTSSSSTVNPNVCTAVVTGTQRVNVRFGPGTVYDVIGGLDVGDTVEVTGQSGSGWYAIDFSGYEAWIAGSVIELSGPCDNLPYTYIPPTPTPPATPTPIPSPTPELPIAGDNEYRGIKVDYFSESPVYLSGAISYPQGDMQDTVTYALTNTQYAYNGEFRLSVSCSGQGAEHVVVTFPDGSQSRCSPTYNFIQYFYRGFSTSGEFTIQFDGGQSNSYVDWNASLFIYDSERSSQQ
ncbi:MAG: hypothetical protein CL607_25710 [Anaerolineaceae bacterium]|nr:hypothetical protein [Anaerolineaceae bacterium]